VPQRSHRPEYFSTDATTRVFNDAAALSMGRAAKTPDREQQIDALEWGHGKKRDALRLMVICYRL